LGVLAQALLMSRLNGFEVLKMNAKKRFTNWLAGLASILALSLTVATPVLAAGQAQEAAPAGVTTSEVDLGYRLGTGDKLRISVFGEPALTGEFIVSGAGIVALPLIGDMKAVGLTTTELQTVIAKTLADGYLNDPRVSIQVLNYRPYYVLGEVNKPGEYPYSNGLTVMNAVATANGFTYRADQRKVFIRHSGAKTEEQLPMGTGVVMVLPGDTIRIAERYF
jgi:polysaccharide export outer membrane protein